MTPAVDHRAAQRGFTVKTPYFTVFLPQKHRFFRAPCFTVYLLQSKELLKIHRAF
jgi:hypothetical protein